MSDCTACLYFSEDGTSDFYSCRILVARKTHRCVECGDAILPRSQHEYAKGRQDGEWWAHRTCLACRDIAESLKCNGYRCHGELALALEYAEGQLGQGCLNKLQTAAGKEKLRRFILTGSLHSDRAALHPEEL